jgi:glycosyltransferase involved in cell wall biosynthesis
MKIIILTQYFLPEMGAPQNRLFELAKGFRARGWEVKVVAAMPNYPTGKIFKDYQGKFSSKDQVEGIDVKRYWIYASNSARAFPRILSMLSFSFTALFSAFFMRRQKPDFLIVESPPLTLAFSAWLISKFSGARMIMNVSDLWPLSAKELGAISEGTLYRSIETLEHFLYKRADLCTGQSAEIVEYIKPRTTSPVYLFRNGVDTTRFIESNQSSTMGEPIRIVYAGLLGVAQGIFPLCEAINFSKAGAEFHIYGTGFDKERIEEFLKANPDRGIKYFGVIPRDNMPDVLQKYDATLVALVKNIYGAVPSKIYESMAAGLPIFFSGEGEGARIIKEHEVGWVNQPGDWNTLLQNIATYSKKDSNARNSIKHHCRNIAVQKFDRAKQIDDFQVYLTNITLNQDSKPR